jgi:hypothetical protein
MSDIASPHKLIQSRHVIPLVHGTSAIDQVNARIAVAATTVLGSMWFFWFCVVLILVELPAVVAARSVMAWVMYISQTVIQLLALPLLGAGQRIISAAQDARAETDHETLVALHTLSVQQIQILRGQNDVLDLLRKALKA